MTVNITDAIKKLMGWCPAVNMKNIVVKHSMEYAYAAGIKGSKLFTVRSSAYEEKAPYSDAMKMLMVLGAISLAFLFFFSVIFDAPQQAQIGLLSAMLIFVIVVWSFFSIKFRITINSVEAIMPPFKYSAPFSEIKGVKIIEKTPWFIGWGLRLWGRKLAFVSMRKSAVEIEKKSGFFRRLVLTTRNPEEFVKMVKENLE